MFEMHNKKRAMFFSKNVHKKSYTYSIRMWLVNSEFFYDGMFLHVRVNNFTFYAEILKKPIKLSSYTVVDSKHSEGVVGLKTTRACVIDRRQTVWR